MLRHTLGKAERINSKKIIDKLFSGSGGKSLVAYPLRAVYMLTPREEGSPVASILVSVSKRHFKHAVKRNRTKRQIREAYRLNKQIVCEPFESSSESLQIAFIWLSDSLEDSALVHRKMKNLLYRIVERETAPISQQDETAQ